MIIKSTFLAVFLVAASYKNRCFAAPVSVAFADPFFETIGSFLGEVVTGAANLVGSAADGVVGGVKAGAEAGGTAVGSGVTAVGEGVGDAIHALGQGIGADGNVGLAINIAGNINQAGGQLTGGIITTLPKLIPLPSDLFRLSIDLIVGVPSAIIFSLINAFCSAATLQSKYVPDIDKINFEMHTRGSDKTEVITSVPIKDAGSLFSNSNFKRNYKTVILATGWLSRLNDGNGALRLIKAGYLCRGGYNFIVVDASNLLLTLYTWSSLNTEVVGEYVGLGVKNLVDSGYPLENIHLIGHSLGAHIVGSAGKYFFSQTNKFIHRITGLDPALPCFNEGENLNQLDRGDALFVDIIHSNPGGFGQRLPVGDADFYTNGFSIIQPGCFDPSCSHVRAFEYFAESIYPGNENGFMAIRCSSLTKLEADFCKSPPVPMGFAAIRNIKVNFFLRTRSSAPYG